LRTAVLHREIAVGESRQRRHRHRGDRRAAPAGHNVDVVASIRLSASRACKAATLLRCVLTRSHSGPGAALACRIASTSSGQSRCSAVAQRLRPCRTGIGHRQAVALRAAQQRVD
jgi:hypothetical protein